MPAGGECNSYGSGYHTPILVPLFELKEMFEFGVLFFPEGPKGLENLEGVIFECALIDRGSGTREAGLLSDFC
jgi:hypothetical protein